jgi:hypothetical protein
LGLLEKKKAEIGKRLMNNKILAKESEETCAEYFINWVNDTYNLDYYVVPNEQEDSEIDVFAISKSGRPTLKLQIVTSRGKTLEMASKNKRRLKQGKKFIGSNVEWVEWIVKAIEQKEKKKYPIELMENLILLIEGCLPVPNPDFVVENFKTLSTSSFKCIYYVSKPILSSQRTEYTEKGYVVPIKDAF